MKLAYLVAAPGIPVQGPTGASGHLRDVVAALRAQGPTRLYAARDVDHRGRFGGPSPAVITGTPGWPSWLPRWRELREVRASRRLARHVLEDAHGGWCPDVLIERHTIFSDAAWRVGDRLGRPWMLEVNAPLVDERLRFEEVRNLELARRWERSVLLAAPCIVTVSPWLKTWLETQVGCRRVHWVPNGVRALRGDRARGRALLGVDEDQKVIGFLGSDRPWQGLEVLPEVAARVGARVALLGRFQNPPEDALTPGFLEGQQLADAVAALDVGLVPYPKDAPPWFCPLKVFQYRAQGTPVVATDVGGVGKLVRGGGSVVPPGDVDALVIAVQRWLAQGRTPIKVRSWSTVASDLRRLAADLPLPRSARLQA